MIGAIIGDIIGSRHEFAPINSRTFDLFSGDSNFTDDTVCTFAVAMGMKEKLDPVETLRGYCARYPMRGYGANFQSWIDNPRKTAYNSYGNGAVMRISPVALFAETIEDAERMAIQWTEITHNHPDAMKAAVTLSRILIRLRDGEDKAAIMDEAGRINLEILSVDEYHNIGGYHINALLTLERAIASVMEADSFESAMRNVVYIGSDDDTTAAVAGPMAELIFGIPEEIVMNALKIFGVRYAGIPRALAELYEDSYLKKNVGYKWDSNWSWVPKIVNYKPVDYTKPGNNDIFGTDAITFTHGFSRIAYVRHSMLQLAKPAKNVAVISIRDDAKWHTLEEGWGATLELSFYDVDSESFTMLQSIAAHLDLPEKYMNKIATFFGDKSWPWRPMFPCDAKKVAQFVAQAHKDGISELVISCDYGKSRSVAVAMACLSSFGAVNFEQPIGKYNQHVYELVKMALDDSLEDDFTGKIKA